MVHVSGLLVNCVIWACGHDRIHHKKKKITSPSSPCLRCRNSLLNLYEGFSFFLFFFVSSSTCWFLLLLTLSKILFHGIQSLPHPFGIRSRQLVLVPSTMHLLIFVRKVWGKISPFPKETLANIFQPENYPTISKSWLKPFLAEPLWSDCECTAASRLEIRVS